MSPLEIRGALQAEQIIEVSAGSGWNGGAFDLDYIHYLSKNMYQFYSNAESVVGYEDRGSLRVRVFLTPRGVQPPWLLNAIVRGTNSPEDFFAPPSQTMVWSPVG